MKRVLIPNFNTNPISRVAEMLYSSTKFHSITIQNLQFGQRLRVPKTFSAANLALNVFTPSSEFIDQSLDPQRAIHFSRTW